VLELSGCHFNDSSQKHRDKSRQQATETGWLIKTDIAHVTTIHCRNSGGGWWREDDPYWMMRDWGDHPMRWWTLGCAVLFACACVPACVYAHVSLSPHAMVEAGLHRTVCMCVCACVCVCSCFVVAPCNGGGGAVPCSLHVCMWVWVYMLMFVATPCEVDAELFCLHVYVCVCCLNLSRRSAVVLHCSIARFHTRKWSTSA
jgi:hypothetical protein